MKYNIRKEGSTLFVAVEGELDVRTSPELEENLLPALKGVTEAEIDLEGLYYLSSAGLRVLLAASKAMEEQDGEMTVKNVSEDVMDILKVTGFDNLFTIV